MTSVYLGGTCNGSKWRNKLISRLKIDYFNPEVDDWNEEEMQNEVNARISCDYLLYVITPKMTGVYAIAEAVDDSNKRSEKTILTILDEDDGNVFTEGQLMSLKAVRNLVHINGVETFSNIPETAMYLNER